MLALRALKPARVVCCWGRVAVAVAPQLYCSHFATASSKQKPKEKSWKKEEEEEEDPERSAVLVEQAVQDYQRLSKSTPNIIVTQMVGVVTAACPSLTIPACLVVLETTKALNVRDLELNSALFARIDKLMKQFTMDQVVALLKALKGYYASPDGTLRKMAAHITPNIPSLNVLLVVDILQGFTRLRKFPDTVFEQMKLRVIALAGEFRPKEICSILLAYLECGNYPRKMIRSLIPFMSEKLHEYNSRDIAAIFHVMSQLGVYYRQFTSRLCIEAVKKANTFSPKDAVTVLGGIAAFELFELECIEAMCARLSTEIPKLESRDVAYLFEALAKFEYYDRHLLISLCNHASNLEIRAPGEVARVLGSLARLHLSGEKKLTKQLLGTIPVPVIEYHTLETSLVLEAIRSFDLYSEALVGGLCEGLMSRPPEEFTAQCCYSLMVSLAELRFIHRGLEDRLVSALMTNADFKPREIASLLHAIAQLQPAAVGPLVKKLCDQALAFEDILDFSDAVMLLHALCVMEEFPQGLFDKIRPLLVLSRDLTSVSDNVLERLNEVNAALSVHQPEWQPFPSNQPTVSSPRLSLFFEQVAQSLSRLRLAHSPRLIKGLSVDITLFSDIASERTVLVLEEASQRFRNRSFTPQQLQQQQQQQENQQQQQQQQQQEGVVLLGRMAFKCKLLAQSQWQVVRLSDLEWPADASLQDELLRNKLRLAQRELERSPMI